MSDSPLHRQVVLHLNKVRRNVTLRQNGYDRHNVHVLVVDHHQFHYHLLCHPDHLDNMKENLSVALAHAQADGESNRLNVIVTFVLKMSIHISL